GHGARRGLASAPVAAVRLVRVPRPLPVLRRDPAGRARRRRRARDRRDAGRLTRQPTTRRSRTSPAATRANVARSTCASEDVRDTCGGGSSTTWESTATTRAPLATADATPER